MRKIVGAVRRFLGRSAEIAAALVVRIPVEGAVSLRVHTPHSTITSLPFLGPGRPPGPERLHHAPEWKATSPDWPIHSPDSPDMRTRRTPSWFPRRSDPWTESRDADASAP